MTEFRIRTPEQLRELALAAKTGSTRHSINAFAAAWGNKLKTDPAATIPYDVTLDVTHGAKLSCTDTRTGRTTDFGALYATAAKDIAMRLGGEQ